MVVEQLLNVRNTEVLIITKNIFKYIFEKMDKWESSISVLVMLLLERGFGFFHMEHNLRKEALSQGR